MPELEIETIREIILGNYRIIYRIQENEVQVVTVHHGARLLNPALMMIKGVCPAAQAPDCVKTHRSVLINPRMGRSKLLDGDT